MAEVVLRGHMREKEKNVRGDEVTVPSLVRDIQKTE